MGGSEGVDPAVVTLARANAPIAARGVPLGGIATLLMPAEDGGGVVSAAATSERGVRVALLALVALSALLLSIAAMHASMVQQHHAAALGSTATTSAMPMGAAAAQMVDDPSSDHAMSGMNLADCLILGMVCFLTAVAVLLFGLLVGRVRRLLRPRAAAHSLTHVLNQLRPPEPPSLLTLSISRT